MVYIFYDEKYHGKRWAYLVKYKKIYDDFDPFPFLKDEMNCGYVLKMLNYGCLVTNSLKNLNVNEWGFLNQLSIVN